MAAEGIGFSRAWIRACRVPGKQSRRPPRIPVYVLKLLRLGRKELPRLSSSRSVEQILSKYAVQDARGQHPSR